MAGDPPRKHFTRSVRYVMQPEKMRYLALYDMNRATDQNRADFLDRVGHEMQAF